VTSVTSLAKGYDPRYLSEGAASGHAGGTKYYADAAGEPPGRWGGRAAARLGLQGEVDARVLQALYMDRVGPDGQRLDARQRARYRPAEERVDAAVAAHLAAHPFATEGDLELVRAAERAKAQHSVPYFDFTVSAAKSVSVLHASLLVAARQARAGGRHGEAGELERDARDITDALEAAARAGLSRAERALYVRTGYHSATSGEFRDTTGGLSRRFCSTPPGRGTRSCTSITRCSTWPSGRTARTPAGGRSTAPSCTRSGWPWRRWPPGSWRRV